MFRAVCLLFCRGGFFGTTTDELSRLTLALDSIKNAASQVAYDLMTYYKGNLSGNVPGILPGPPPDGDYYWFVRISSPELLPSYNAKNK